MAQQTAMQEFIDLLNETLKSGFYPSTWSYSDAIVAARDIAESMLEKEKEQILEAVKFGQNKHTVSIPEDEMIAKNYFNDKYEVVEEFNQNK